MSQTADYIRPYPQNAFYWQYAGKPVMLLGGSVEDNLFQIADVAEHLDLLQAAGGNYVRCTMSSRDVGNLFPFKRDTTSGLYDLDVPNDDYWDALARFIAHAEQRDIIVQVELWDRWDTTGPAWENNPFNPVLNRNYSVESSGLPSAVGVVPFREANPFFYTVPALDDNAVVLPYQIAFIDKLLSITLAHPNVLYCIDNETQGHPEWGWYWSDKLRADAAAHGVPIHITEMWEPHSLSHPWHRHTLDERTRYSFFDASQNTHLNGDDHAQALTSLRETIGRAGAAMPINVVKIYGANTFEYGRTRDTLERFWRHIFSGLAATRFHRPPTGIGLSDTAQRHIRAARNFVTRFPIFQSEPRTHWLRNRSPGEAFCLANAGVAYALFFPDGGDVLLQPGQTNKDDFVIAWLDIETNTWVAPQPIALQSGTFRICTPRESGYWVAHIHRDGAQ